VKLINVNEYDKQSDEQISVTANNMFVGVHATFPLQDGNRN